MHGKKLAQRFTVMHTYNDLMTIRIDCGANILFVQDRGERERERDRDILKVSVTRHTRRAKRIIDTLCIIHRWRYCVDDDRSIMSPTHTMASTQSQ